MIDAVYEPPRGPAYEPKSPWPPLPALLVTGAAVVAAFLVAGGLALGGMAAGVDGPTAIVTGTLAQQATLIAAAWYLAGSRGGRPVDVLALEAPRGGARSYMLGFLTLLAAVVVMSTTIHAINPGWIKDDLKPFVSLLNSPVWWVMFPMVGIGAPLAEELLFRGFLFSALARSRIGVMGAAIITSAGWAVVHSYSLVGILQVFIIGLVFSWMLVRTGSLRVPILVHGVYNATLTALMVSEAGRGYLTP